MRARRLAAAAGLLVAAASTPAAAGPPPAELGYVPPPPGSYELHRIMPAPDGEVLDVDGRSQRLSRFTRGRITLLGFIYTTCVDPQGCPLAYQVFEALRQRVLATPALHGKVQLVTLSFDPARDSPEVMRGYGGSRVHYGGSRVKDERGVRWYFLTTRSARELLPLVEGFGQDVREVAAAPGGPPRRELSHTLKVFLIDRAGAIREIYTSTFLHLPVVLNDVATLLLEDGARRE